MNVYKRLKLSLCLVLSLHCGKHAFGQLDTQLVHLWSAEIQEDPTKDILPQADSLFAQLEQKSDSFFVILELSKAYLAFDKVDLITQLLGRMNTPHELTSLRAILYYFLWGTVGFMQGDIQLASQYFDQSAEQYRMADSLFPELNRWGALATQQSGDYQVRLGNYQQGYEVLQEALRISQENNSRGATKSILLSLGNAGYWAERENESILYLTELSKLCEEDQDFDLNLTGNHLNISKYWQKKADFPKAIFHVKKAIFYLTEIIEERLPMGENYSKADYQRSMSDAYDLYGQILSKQNQNASAADAFSQAIQAGEQINFQLFNRSLARSYLHLAEVQLKTEHIDQAYENCQQALENLIPEWKRTTPFSFPKIDILYPEVVLVETFYLLAQSFVETYKTSDSQQHLSHALTAFQLANHVSSLLRTKVGVQQDKLLYTEETHKRAGDALEAAFLRFESQASVQNWREAFDFTERSKANLLLEAASDQEAKSLVGIPDSTLVEETELLQQQIDLELAIRSLKLAKQPQADSIKSLESQLYKHRLKLDAFHESLSQQYPTYFQFKYKQDSLDLQAFRNKVLDENTALVEYFVGEKYVYACMLSQQNHDFYRWDIADELKVNIASFLSSITSFQEKEKAQFDSLGYRLYQQLLAPLALEQFSQLIIIPDRELALLPFDALLTAPVQTKYNFATYPFLIKEKTISYGYSAQLLAYTRTRDRSETKAQKPFLGIAPGNFPGSSLASLPHTTQEVRQLYELLGGEILTDSYASKAAFVQRANQYQVLHLSTHARRWDSLDQSAWIALRCGDTTEYFYMAELAGLRLQNDLVILSACETGLGKIEPGEGVMSLARGFTYAGSQATLQSLWQLRPAAAEPLIQAFYEELIAGKDKATALREAKLRLLNGENISLHAPIMWAAFVPIGDMRPIALEAQGNSWLLFVSLMLIFSLIAGYVFIRRGRINY